MDPRRRAVLGAFRDEGRRTRLHTAVRWRSAPLEAIDALVPPAGAILDLGCGHGVLALLLAHGHPGRTVHAVDVDGAKVATAGRAAARAGLADRVRVEQVAADWRPPPGGYDAVVVVDVLYLLGRAAAAGLLAAVGAAVRPGGVVVVKEVGAAPRWKAALSRAQEQLAVRVLSITQGATVEVVPEGDLVAGLAGAGLAVERHPLDHGYVHPHLAVVGRRPAISRPPGRETR